MPLSSKPNSAKRKVFSLVDHVQKNFKKKPKILSVSIHGFNYHFSENHSVVTLVSPLSG
jgi:hypothetical protein